MDSFFSFNNMVEMYFLSLYTIKEILKYIIPSSMLGYQLMLIFCKTKGLLFPQLILL